MDKQLIPLKAELQSLLSRRNVIANQRRQVDQELQKLASTERQLQNLQLEHEASTETYQNYRKKLEEAQVYEDMNRQKLANISIIQEPAVANRPITPNVRLNILVSVVLGSILSIGLALVSEIFSSGLSNPSLAERKIGVPVLTVDDKPFH
jgi:uncharacterized protein involved in exopolysaccharide biosynthesis